MAVRIVTDSTSYLPEAELERYGIQQVSLAVTYADGTTERELDIDSSRFYKRLVVDGEIPKSSQPSVAEMAEAFRAAVSAGDSVVGVFLSSKMSGTYASALLASDLITEEFPDAVIEIVDSLSNCMQLGMCVLEAARAARRGDDAASVAAAARAAITRTRFLFTPHDLVYLKKGGRIGGASALVGTLLQIRPVLTVEAGETEVFTKVRTKRRAMSAIAEAFEAEAERAGLLEVVVHHIDDEAEGRALAALLQHVVSDPIPVIPLGPVIGLHVGPGTVGVVYRTELEVRPLDRKG